MSPNGQWEGELGGKMGHFPFTHVEFIDRFVIVIIYIFIVFIIIIIAVSLVLRMFPVSSL
jgi:hypothetical protein